MSDINNYLDEKGLVKVWPAKDKNQQQILELLASKFEASKFYTEKEVNEILNQHHTFADPALLRRELYMKHFLDREPNGSKYWKMSNGNP